LVRLDRARNLEGCRMKTKGLRRKLDNLLADSGLKPAQSTFIQALVILAAVDLRGDAAIPGLRVKVTDKAALRAYMVKTLKQSKAAS